MKKALLYLGTLAIVLAAFVACSGNVTTGSKKRSGWIDENTYAVKADGLPQKGIENPGERKIMARKSAVMQARNEILKQVAGSYIESKGATADARILGELIKEEAAGAFGIGGRIDDEKYDKETGVMTIVYIVEVKNFKKLMMDAMARRLEEAVSKSAAEDVIKKKDAGMDE